MKLAIMQPYLLPYIGYFQLINTVDCLVFYDDVNFIKGGWIHRNRIIINGEPIYFSVPIEKQSSFLRINETQINNKLIQNWKNKFLKTLLVNYTKAPFFDSTYELISKILNNQHKTISELAISSIIQVSEFLELPTKFKRSSLDFPETTTLKGAERLIEICKTSHANTYINPIGGQELYSKEQFSKKAIKLFFLKNKPIQYKQFDNKFVSWLSIIDVLMFNSKVEVVKMLNEYELIE